MISSNNPFVIGIRDTETVVNLQKRLKNSKQILIVGNGGIATELVYEIENCKILWVIKDEYISHVFFDAAAARFFHHQLTSTSNSSSATLKDENETPSKRAKYTITSDLLKLYNFMFENLFVYFCRI